MDVLDFHIHFFLLHQLDPIIWLRMSRSIILFVACIVMFTEPMLCGGKNRTFHRLLSGAFFSAAFYNFGIAKARMEILISDPASLVGLDLMLFEVVYTGTSLLILMKLLYDYFKYKGYQRVKHQASCSECKHSFQP